MLKINELSRLHLGVEKENLSRTIEIDMSAWAQTYPNATVEILHRRHGDQTKALVTGAEYDSETMLLSWTPTEYDTYYEGFGVAEIRMVEGEVVKKTKDLIITAVCPSVIDGSGNVVASNYQAFLNSVIGYKNDAQTAAAAAEAAAVHGPYIDDETGNWFVWDAEEEEYVNTGIHAQGPPGSIDNVYATGIAMSITDPTTVKQAMDSKANASAIPTKTSQLTNDSGFLTQHQDISGKADKDTDAVTGNFAAFDASGNPVDSGHKHSDYLTQHQDISGKLDKDQGSGNAGKFMKVGSDGLLTPDAVPDPTGKADKVSGATSGNFAGLDSNGNLTDSGSKASDFLTSHQDISGKADKVSGATSGDFAGLDGNGNLTDSGKKASDFAAAGDLYGNKIPMSSSDSTKISTNIANTSDSLNYLRRGLVHVAKLTGGNWQLNSGENAAIGEYISVNGYMGQATAAITGGSTNIVEHTNWEKVSTGGALNEVAAAKVDVYQGTGNAGKALGIGNDGNVTPVPFSGDDFTGATASTAGVHGYVPAPAAGDQAKVLTGGGTWEVSPGAKLITVDLTTITNVSGSYTGTTSDERITSDMKPVTLILGTPSAIRAKPTVTCNNGSITFSCSDVAGTTTATVSVIKVIDDPLVVTSTEFDVLNNRIGDLSDLTTTAQTSAVDAINELDADVGALNSNIATINENVLFKAYSFSVTGSTAVWTSPIRYKDMTIELPSVPRSPNQIYAVSHNNQFWVASVTGSDNSKNVTLRVLTVATSDLSGIATVWYQS